MAEFELDDLREGLAEFAPAEKKAGRSPREERIIAGFEDIQRFVDEHKRAPVDGDDRDIFERIYAVRLDRLRQLEDCRSLLEPLDRQQLLTGELKAGADEADEVGLDELRAAFGGDGLLSELRHVRSSAEKQAAEEIANRRLCADFAKFQPLFEKVKAEIASGIRASRHFELKAEIRPGSYFIVGGQMAHVAEMGEMSSNAQGRTDARMRVIFDNGTESKMKLRSLQRALHKDGPAGRRITDPVAGPLFSTASDEGDLESGTIYVLRSKSEHPEIARHREFVHKIGVTGNDVRARIANARKDATYLLAEVEVVAEYKLFEINRTKLEKLLHRFFGPAAYEIEIADRFGNPVRPREWFFVPLHAINEAVERIQDGTISKYRYDPQLAALVKG